MKIIWKYELKMTENQVIQMPANAVILSVQPQNGSYCMWAIVDPTEPKEARFFEIFVTGQYLPEALGGLNYLGTFLLNNDSLVFHVFERIVFKSNKP